MTTAMNDVRMALTGLVGGVLTFGGFGSSTQMRAA